MRGPHAVRRAGRDGPHMTTDRTLSKEMRDKMSHAGRRIATTAAAAAAVALPIAAAGSAFADTTGLPMADSGVGQLAASGMTDQLSQALPLSGVGGLTSINSPLSSLPVSSGLSGLGGGGASGLTGDLMGGSSPVSSLPVVGGLSNGVTGSALSGVPLVNQLPGANNLNGGAAAPANAADTGANSAAAPALQPDAAAMQVVQDYNGKHRK